MTCFSRTDDLLPQDPDRRYITAKVSAAQLRQAIVACPRKEACEVMQSELLRLTQAMPIAALFHLMDEARSWASLSTPDENAAYCAACFEALPLRRKLAFLEFAKRLCNGA